MKCLAIFIVLVAAASAIVPCDPLLGSSCTSTVTTEVVPGGTTTTVKKVSTTITESQDGGTTTTSGAVNNASTSAANAALDFFKSTTKLLNTVTRNDVALSASLVTLVHNVNRNADKLSGCIKPVTNNLAQITTGLRQLTSVVTSTTPTSIHNNIDQITSLLKGFLTSVDQSFEITYQNIGESSQIIKGAIAEVSETMQQFVIVKSAIVEQTPESIITSALNFGYAINQLLVSINQVTNKVNVNNPSPVVIEALKSLPVGFAQILVIASNTVITAAKYMKESSKVQEVLYGLGSTITKCAEDLTGVLSQINKSLTANDGANVVPSLDITVTNMSSNLNTLLGKLNINIDSVPARYLSVELGVIINQLLNSISKYVEIGIGFAKIISIGSPVFGNSFLQLSLSTFDLLKYIGNMSASNLSENNIKIVQNKISSYINDITSQMSQIVAAAESAVLIYIAENTQTLVTDLVTVVNKLGSNIIVLPVDLNEVLGEFFITLVAKTLAAGEFVQHIADFKVNIV